MSVDRTKILEAAQKHLAKGAYDKAIAELQKLVKADPSDVRTWLKIGDLFAKKGSTREAVDTYAKVADQYATQGFFLKAVAVHKQILKLDPTRLDVQLKLADAYENLQLVSDALATYEMVAAGYARAGNIDKALATLAKMVELDPENIPVRIKYAEALSKANRTKEAADAFEAGGKLLKAQGRLDDWIKVAERLLFHRADDVAVARELSKLYLERQDAKRALAKLQLCFKADPKDVPTLEMLAEAFHQLGQLPKTISVYREVARIHQEANRVEDRARTLKRILELDPGDAEARTALAAYAQPQQSAAVQAGPSAASVRRDIAPPPGAVVAPARAPQPAPPDSTPTEDELEELDDDVIEEHEDEVYDEATYSRDDDQDYPSAETYVGGDDGEEDVIIVDDEDEPARAPARASQRPGSELPPEIARDAQIAKLLTECEVFLRYGLKQKVVDQLRRVLEIEPEHVEARERLKDMLIERGEIAAAIDELMVLSDLFSDRPAVALLYVRQALELDPDHIGAAHRANALQSPSSGMQPAAESHRAPASGAHPNAGYPSADDASGSRAVDDDVVDEEHTMFEPPSRPGASGSLDGVAAAPAEMPGDSLLDAVPPEDGVFFVDDEDTSAPTRDRDPVVSSSQARTNDPYSSETRVAVPPPALGAEEPDSLEPDPRDAMVDDGEVHELRARADGDPLAPMSPEEFESAPLRPSAPEVASAAPRMSMPPGEVEELLDEADFFVAQGLYDEAMAMLRDSHAAHPRNRLIADKLAEIEELAAQQAASAPARSVAPEADNSFQLAERLAEDLGEAEQQSRDLGSDVLDVEQVFAQFKKGVEQQVGLEDTETHFDLGIAYKEMGLLQDAIAEFQLCLVNPQKQCIAHTMIGLCNLEKGEVAEAISSFKKGLYAENKTDREELGLYYELGRAYELLHDPKEALYYYEKVRKRDATFRHVNDRIVALTRPAPAAPAPALANDDIDAAFDDLMGDRES
ncbi:tetratricopeptide repeat protein [Sandaracinus amylolyticus]|uniref:TPR domain protein n=1 Tax=Sandaracinus amylolyticus TaxID=927083 RepID=A0A0F6W328_9BACT|nr:tetratricopeptide repeat protein [Sandaracinus amylolyticus]AKF06161.1 TPR domain protein [Sandaracinus amylolyticus]